MSYRHSRARREFETQLEQAILELRPLHAIAQRGGRGGATRLLAAYYVFAFAQLEVYVKGFVEDALNAILVSSPALEKWPDLMIGYLLHKGEGLGSDYRQFSINEDEGAILEKVSQIARKIALWSEGGAVITNIDAASFLEKKKYPSPKNLPQLFKRLGINPIWAVINAAGKMNGLLVLQSLNDLRTNIAHEGKVPPGFGISDFRDRIDQMKRFVAALDRGVSKEFCPRLMSRATWNLAMT